MKDVIVLPAFGIKEDEIVVEQFKQFFPSTKIATVDSNEIADQGGILNCLAWNIQNGMLGYNYFNLNIINK